MLLTDLNVSTADRLLFSSEPLKTRFPELFQLFKIIRPQNTCAPLQDVREKKVSRSLRVFGRVGGRSLYSGESYDFEVSLSTLTMGPSSFQR